VEGRTRVALSLLVVSLEVVSSTIHVAPITAPIPFGSTTLDAPKAK